MELIEIKHVVTQFVWELDKRFKVMMGQVSFDIPPHNRIKYGLYMELDKRFKVMMGQVSFDIPPQ